jgi:hypothetical protein
MTLVDRRGDVALAGTVETNERREEQVSSACHDLQEWAAAGGSLLGYLRHHPAQLFTTAWAITRLPRLEGVFSRDAEGSALRHAARDGKIPLGPLTHKSVLVLPDRPGEYSEGPSKQTLRRKSRKATKLGVRWKRVDSPEERLALVARATAWERTQPDDRYRKEDADNDDLLSYGLWLVAYREPDESLLLCVAPVDREWATLRHYRTIGQGDAQTEARYLLMEVLVEELVARGVRYLLDGRAPAGLPNGLRHFQRMVGFRIHRVRSRYANDRPVRGALRDVRPRPDVPAVPEPRTPRSAPTRDAAPSGTSGSTPGASCGW